MADLAVVVVTRHSYQNRQVVEFLEQWLAHGRPWMLVYNEAPGEALTRQHAAVLAADVGTPPAAVFRQPLDVAVQDGSRALDPRLLNGGSPGRSLGESLFDLEETRRIKESALAASLSQFRGDLAELEAELRAGAEVAGELQRAAARRVATTAGEMASSAMPAGPFLVAFRRVLDRRGHPLGRGLRGGVRSLGARLTALAARLRPRRLGRRGDAAGETEGRLLQVERAELESRWAALWEGLARDLGSEGRVAARARAGPELTRALEADLADARREPARQRALEALALAAAELENFEEGCEELVAQAIEDRGYAWDMQLAADFVTVAPLALAAVVIVQTGGLGVDLGVAGGGAVSAFLAERYSHFLGARVTQEARRRWTTQRSRVLEGVLCGAALERSWPLLEAAGSTARADELRELRESLA